MTMKPEDYEDFQKQLEWEKANSSAKDEKGNLKTKKDEDGTEYEWDEMKKAWFPKLSPELLIQFQSNYTADEDSKKNSGTYKDPQTHIVYNWNPQTQKWVPSGQYDPNNPKIYKDAYGNSYEWDTKKQTWRTKKVSMPISLMKPASATPEDHKIKPPEASDKEQEAPKDSEKETIAEETATYTHPETGVVYKWNKDKWSWVADDGSELKPAVSSEDKSFTDNTGAAYYWDTTKNIWVEDTDVEQTDPKEGKKKRSMLNKRKVTEAAWFDVEDQKNTSVYVSGLPPDVTEQEFADFMSKCGIIMPHPQTQLPKVKLYKDRDNNLKGDGICCYLKKESIDLAIQLLHDTEIRGGYKVEIDIAKFELKGQYDKAKKPKMMSRKEKKKLLKQNQKLLDWKLNRTDKEIKKTDRVLIFKNMFHPKEFEEDPVLITDIRDDLRNECEKFGPVKKVIVFDRHTDGVCSVAFKEFEHADKCQTSMNNRWFAKKQIQVSVWDGNTDYQIEETDKEREARMEKWEDFLESK